MDARGRGDEHLLVVALLHLQSQNAPSRPLVQLRLDQLAFRLISNGVGAGFQLSAGAARQECERGQNGKRDDVSMHRNLLQDVSERPKVYLNARAARYRLRAGWIKLTGMLNRFAAVIPCIVACCLAVHAASAAAATPPTTSAT